MVRVREALILRCRRYARNQPPNRLWIGIDGPSNIVLGLAGGAFGRFAPVALRGDPPAADLPAYAHVLLDVLTGGSALSVRGDGAE